MHSVDLKTKVKRFFSKFTSRHVDLETLELDPIELYYSREETIKRIYALLELPDKVMYFLYHFELVQGKLSEFEFAEVMKNVQE